MYHIFVRKNVPERDSNSGTRPQNIFQLTDPLDRSAMIPYITLDYGVHIPAHILSQYPNPWKLGPLKRTLTFHRSPEIYLN